MLEGILYNIQVGRKLYFTVPYIEGAVGLIIMEP